MSTYRLIHWHSMYQNIIYFHPFQLARVKREYEEMWKAASSEVKQIFTRKYIDKSLREHDEAALTTSPSIQPVIDVMVEALTVEEPDFMYLVDGSNISIDVMNVSFCHAS